MILSSRRALSSDRGSVQRSGREMRSSSVRVRAALGYSNAGAPVFYPMPPGITYGVELEYLFPARFTRPDVESKMLGTQWKVKNDRSIQTTYQCSLGLELNSPVLEGTSGFDSITKACTNLASLQPETNQSTAMHVHVGRKGGGWQLQQLKNVCSNWILLEASVELLCPSHRKNSIYCRSNKAQLLSNTRDAIMQINNTQSTTALMELFCPGADVRREGRRYRLNLRSLGKYGTIEFRPFSGSKSASEVIGIAALCSWLAYAGSERAPSDVFCTGSSASNLSQLTTFLAAGGQCDELIKFVNMKAQGLS